MSKNSPYDDEIESHEDEFITESSVALPLDSDENLNFSDINVILEHIKKIVSEKYPHKLLTDITVSFTYEDGEGFCSFENVNYPITNKD